MTAARLAAARPDLHAAGFTYPLLTLRESALANNIEAMAAYCDRAGVALAPHGKTAMSPELAARQLAHGAWGITVATVGQLRTYRAFGFPRLLLANELVDEAGIAWLAAELAADPGFEAYCYVDSTDGVAILDRVLSRQPARQPAGRRLGVLVEIGHDHGRTGCRTDAAALEVAKAAAATGTLRVAGVAGYEGSIGAGSEAETLGLIASFCRRLRGLAGSLAPTAVGDEFIVTAGGSAYFDVVTRELTAGGTAGMTVILRSGAYVTHDHGHYDTVSRPPGWQERGGRAGAAARARAVGAGAVLPRARPGAARRRPPRRRLRHGAAGAAARRARGRGLRGQRRGDQAERPACLPAAGRRDGPGARRPGVPGDLASVHHTGQMASDPGGERRRPRDRYGARFFLSQSARK